ncbi:MAG: hypothetical protein J5592_02105, partial [Clostridia bacterium]|nr:hypothetical protein [Clostridia bacterium]
VLKKSDFFNTPAESADRIPQILLENCGFCPEMLDIMLFFQAKNEKDRHLSLFPGRDRCGAVKNPRFLNSPIFDF